ncbi:MAG: type II toxin-antitoxin system RelE/ParE family toxin [Candidatus Aenigmarchaeota archaeon]|nr:type II toxin-antitoxin system RelE/ParE family toxin [Candidatus Aenigmarchaeota archaeon]
MAYSSVITPSLERILKKLIRKNPLVYERISRKMREIVEDPHQYKPLSNVMVGVRRVHFDPFVLTFTIDEKEKKVIFLDFAHHDRIYR